MRTEPLTDDEWAKLRAAPKRMRWKQGEPVPNEYSVVIEALYHLGCHPSVLAKRDKLRIYEDSGVWLAEWRRPKTDRFCVMNLPAGLVAPLRAYLVHPYDRRHIWRIVSQAGVAAGLEGVGPRVLRHTMAMRVFREDGPGAVQGALGISDRLVAVYTARDARKLAVERGKKSQAAESGSTSKEV